MESQIFVLILSSLLAADALPMKWFNTRDDVNFDNLINTPLYYYYVPNFSPYSSHELIHPGFEFDGPSGMEHKNFLTDRTLLGLFSTSDTESVEIYAYPFQEFINRVFFGGQMRPIRIWSWFHGNKPVSVSSESAIMNGSGVSSAAPIVDNENESVIIESE